MDPLGVALQGRNEGYPGPSAGPTAVQYTSINVAPEAPQDHVVWSIFNLFYGNPCCLGLAAFIFSIKERNEGYPGPSAGPTTVQYTLLNVAPEAPHDHVVWSILNLFYGNPCCLGLAAFIFSIKARDRKVAGDLHGARHYGSTARCLNIWATVLLSICCLILIFIIIATSNMIKKM